jgi:hypothetical protein
MIYCPRDGGYDLSRMMASRILGQVSVYSDFDFCVALSFVERQVRSSNERTQIRSYCHSKVLAWVLGQSVRIGIYY